MKRNFFNIVAVMLAVTLLIFTGCSTITSKKTTTSDDQNNKPSPKDSSDVLTILLSDSDPTSWFLFKIGKNKYPEIKTRIIDKSDYGVDDDADFLKKVASEIMTGGGPDIISPKIFKNINGVVGAFEDLTPFLEKDSNYNKADYSEAMLAASTFDGKQLFVPSELLLPLYITTEEYEKIYNFEGKNLYEIIDIHAENNIPASPFAHVYEPLFINDYAEGTTGLSEPGFLEFIKKRHNLIEKYEFLNGTAVPFDESPIVCVPGAVSLNVFATVRTHTDDTPIVLPALDEQGKFTAYLNGLGINANSKNKENAYKLLSLLFTMDTDIDTIMPSSNSHPNFLSDLSENPYYVYANKSMQERYYNEIFTMFKSGAIYRAENSIIDSSKLQQDELIAQYLSFYDQLDRCLYSKPFEYSDKLADYVNRKTDLSDSEIASLVEKEAGRAEIVISE